jgi:4-amino-4-deoxy-L-arabinose transferase-like glycosyltransferase
MTAVTAGQHTRTWTRSGAKSTTAPGRRYRIALAALLAATAALYLAGLSRNGWANDFYSAAVQAGTKSWKAFFFGSFDSANFITVDKTPASLWVMELSGRAFGLNYWSMLVPQALEGVASVAVLYAAVKRWHGPAAGLLAGAALAVTPVAALMFRFNNPDSLLVLLMTAAAYGTVRAVESGKTRWLVLAGALLGFGFLTKMLQAFLVLPAFGLAYLVAGPRRLPVRLAQLAAGLLAVVAAAGWWVTAVMLTPAADRPYVGGSTNDSILQLALGYNGLGRLDGNETGSVGFTGNRGGGPAFGGSTGLSRLFGSEMGGQISWLLPAAVIAVIGLLWLSLAGRPGRVWRLPAGWRLSRDLSAVLIWGGWLVVTGVVFSYMQGIIHPYYTVALAPAIGALVGIGAVRLWQSADRWPARALLAAGMAVSAIWAYTLLNRTPDWLPTLRYVVLFGGLAAAAALLVADRLGATRRAPAAGGPVVPGADRASLPRWNAAASAGDARRRTLVSAAITIPAAAAILAGPLAYSVDTAATAHAGALPTAGPAVTAGFGGPGGTGGAGGVGPGGAGGFGPGGTGSRGSTGGTGTGGTGFPSAGTGAPSGSGGGFASGGTGTGSTGTGRTGTGSTGTGTGGFGARGAGGGPGGLGGSTTVSSALTKLLERDSSSYTWAAATVGSESAAPLQLATGLPIMSIGGFNGTDPAPSLAAFERLVAEHKIHYFVGENGDSFGGGSGVARQISSWVSANFRSQTVGGVAVYNLTQPRS